jgi:hypothetical protein
MAIRKQLIISRDEDRSGIETLIRVDKPTFGLTVPLYTAADPTPRPITHWWTSFTQQTPLPSIETPVTGCKDVYPSSYFEEYFHTDPTYPNVRREALGLTTSET